MPTDQYCVVLTTFSDDLVGKRMINSLIEKHLAACVQVQSIESFYHWKGEVACDKEKLVLIKTKDSLYESVEKDILANHNYETPEIIKLPITSGFSGYLNWIEEECSFRL